MAKSSMRDRLMARKKSIKDSQAGGAFHTIKEGVTRFRHLPMSDEEEPCLEVIYFYLGEDLKGYISPATFGEKCAIMKGYKKFKESADPDDREFAKKFSPKKKFFGFGVKYRDENGNEVDESAGAKPILLTPALYTDLINMYLDEKEAGDFTNPTTGYDVKYERTGKTMTDTEYSVRPCKSTKTPKKYRDKVYNIEEEVRKLVPSYADSKEIAEKFFTMDMSDSKKKDDDDEPKKKKKKKNRDL